MKHLTLAAALWAALAAAIASAAPPPPIAGGVRAPSGFRYSYTLSPNPTLVRPDYTIYPSGATGPAFGYQGNRYPLGGAPSRSRIVWYW